MSPQPATVDHVMMRRDAAMARMVGHVMMDVRSPVGMMQPQPAAMDVIALAPHDVVPGHLMMMMGRMVPGHVMMPMKRRMVGRHTMRRRRVVTVAQNGVMTRRHRMMMMRQDGMMARRRRRRVMSPS